jgi:molybdenum cofactor biosynthesis protein B
VAHDRSLRVATITVSDTRTEADDEGGAVLRALLEKHALAVSRAEIVRDDASRIQAAIRGVCDDDAADAIVTTGGTGISPRDVTYEAVDALLEKRLDGVGEAFRRLSWDAIGPRAVLSRAVAGTFRGRIVVALPGSPKALALAIDAIVAPILHHAAALARGEKLGH